MDNGLGRHLLTKCSKVLVHYKIINLNTVQHPKHSWESCHLLELLERLLSARGISVWGKSKSHPHMSKSLKVSDIKCT